MGLAICKKLNMSPVDTTSIMLGGYADMNFLEFLFMDGRPGIFWAVELGALFVVIGSLEAAGVIDRIAQLFVKIGVPFTLTAVIVGYVFIWLVWAAA